MSIHLFTGKTLMVLKGVLILPKEKVNCHGELIGQQNGLGLESPVKHLEKTMALLEVLMPQEEKYANFLDINHLNH